MDSPLVAQNSLMVPSSLTASSSLMSMPLEVLIHIASYLTTTEYGMLRRSCKHLEASFFKLFAREFFTKRQFMLTEFSLQALVDISKSRFGPYLSYLIISVERPKLRDVTRTPTGPHIPMPSEDDKFNKYREESLSHQALISTGQDCELLAEALGNLPNLVTIGMRDWSSRSRFRDGMAAKWNTYGATTLLQETGIELQRVTSLYRNEDYPPHVFRTILRAFGITPKTKPERFEVILRKTSLSDPAFYIPRYVEATVEPVLANLKALYLDLNDWFPAPQMGRYCLQSGVALTQFLCKLTSLEHLRLNFNDYHNSDDDVRLLRWLSGRPTGSGDSQALSSSVKPPPDPIKFDSLSQIDIGFVEVEPEDLAWLYKKYKSTLRSISLHKVTLCAPAGKQRNANQWARLLDMISTSGLTHLSNISIVSPSQSIYDDLRVDPVKINFSFKSSTPESEMRWSGSDLNQGVQDIKHMLIGKGEDLISNSEEESTEDDEDELMVVVSHLV